MTTTKNWLDIYENCKMFSLEEKACKYREVNLVSHWSKFKPPLTVNMYQVVTYISLNQNEEFSNIHIYNHSLWKHSKVWNPTALFNLQFPGWFPTPCICCTKRHLNMCVCLPAVLYSNLVRHNTYKEFHQCVFWMLSHIGSNFLSEKCVLIFS